jgi:hypothetical protein
MKPLGHKAESEDQERPAPPQKTGMRSPSIAAQPYAARSLRPTWTAECDERPTSLSAGPQ